LFYESSCGGTQARTGIADPVERLATAPFEEAIREPTGVACVEAEFLSVDDDPREQNSRYMLLN
jgi:hypothetical protein